MVAINTNNICNKGHLKQLSLPQFDRESDKQ